MASKLKKTDQNVSKGNIAENKRKDTKAKEPIGLPIGQENVFVISIKMKDRKAKERQ